MSNPEGCNQYKRCGGGRGAIGAKEHKALRTHANVRLVRAGRMQTLQNYGERNTQIPPLTALLHSQPGVRKSKVFKTMYGNKFEPGRGYAPRGWKS